MKIKFGQIPLLKIRNQERLLKYEHLSFQTPIIRFLSSRIPTSEIPIRDVVVQHCILEFRTVTKTFSEGSWHSINSIYIYGEDGGCVVDKP